MTVSILGWISIARALAVALLFQIAPLGDTTSDSAARAGRSAPESSVPERFGAALALFDDATRLREERPSERSEFEALYRKAATGFTEVWTGGHSSFETAMNAANAYWFAGDIGNAALWYRRALAIEPSSRDAAAALELVRSGLPVQRKTSSGASLGESLFFWHDPRYLSLRTALFFVGFPCAWLAFSIELGRRRWPWLRWLILIALPLAPIVGALSYLLGVRRPFLVAGLVAFVPSLAILASLTVEANVDRLGRDAVVLVEVIGRNGDGEAYQPSHSKPFPPGTEVEIRETRSRGSAAWLDVRLLDGSSAWIPATAVERVITAPK
jgi:hypothetical protein